MQHRPCHNVNQPKYHRQPAEFKRGKANHRRDSFNDTDSPNASNAETQLYKRGITPEYRSSDERSEDKHQRDGNERQKR